MQLGLSISNIALRRGREKRNKRGMHGEGETWPACRHWTADGTFAGPSWPASIVAVEARRVQMQV
jgi:hypothetical protein